MGPFKCPECGIWWVGLEHRCSPQTIQAGTNAYLHFGHCHGCLSIRCDANDHRPCSIHANGWTVT